MSIEQKEVIRRLCNLATEVGARKFQHSLAHDCFCDDRTAHGGSFIFDEPVLEYIEAAVKFRLAREGAR